MKKLDSSALLKQLILLKEVNHLVEGRLLKEHFRQTYESVMPMNIIRNAFNKMFAVREVRVSIVDMAIGATTGFVAKKVFTGRSDNPLIKLSGIILEMVVASKVTQNADEIKILGSIILNKIVNRHSDFEKT
jgi:hypothetical protein